MRTNEAIKQMYSEISGRPWPKGWKLYWNVQGMTLPSEKMIYLAAPDIKEYRDDAEVLFHELVHMTWPDLKHGRGFDKLANQFEKEGREWAKKTKLLKIGEKD